MLRLSFIQTGTSLTNLQKAEALPLLKPSILFKNFYGIAKFPIFRATKTVERYSVAQTPYPTFRSLNCCS